MTLRPRAALIAIGVASMAAIVTSPATATQSDVLTHGMSNHFLVIGGELSIPNRPCMPGGQGELVALAGQSRVVTQVTMTSTGPYVAVYISLTDEMGTGRSSGLTYLAVGDFRTGVQLSPGAPGRIPIATAFDLVQVGACPPIAGGATINGTLVFKSDWTLDFDASRLTFGPSPR